MPAQSKYVCVIKRNRDFGQVPLALKEAGLLDRYVTEYYAPDAPPSWLPDALRRRRAEGLPRADVSVSWPHFLLQALSEKLPLTGAAPLRKARLASYYAVDRALAKKAARLASARGSAIYGYAGTLPATGEVAPGTRVIDFEYHPHPQLGWEILSEDARRYPEVAWSIAREEQQLLIEPVTESWKTADAIVCASRMTGKALEHVGCPADQITVVPYAFDPPAAPAPRPQGPCRFLFVGQGIQRKGLHHLIRCWRELDPKDATLTVVNHYVDPGIAALAEGSPIRMLGGQRRADLDALYAAADVFVMPSLVEGFGLVYLEAMAAGCHVIGTENTGLPELPMSDEAMTVLPAGDLDALSRALADCAERKAAGRLDPAAIVAETAKWQWRQFRQAIADHARGVLAR